MEAEIQRKKEHVSVATNFEKARGFIRTNWKSKNFNPSDDPTKYDSSTDESDVEANERDEAHDQVDEFADDLMRTESKIGNSTAKKAPRFVDITAESDHISYKGDTETQLATLKAI